MGRLEGRSVVLTGANSGIGRAILNRFLTEGANVVGVSRKQDQFEDLAENHSFVEFVGDVTAYETSLHAVEIAESHFGKLDCFIANAGVWDFHKRITKLLPPELEAGFDEIMAVNLKGALFAAHASFDALKKSGGSVVMTGSNSCFRSGGGGPLYMASKFGLRGLVKQLALEFAPHVRVNAVAPGATDTSLGGSAALAQDAKEMNSDSARIKAMGDHIPLGRVSQPEEHAGAYVMLASEADAKYMTGTIILSDGGLVG